jgi:hypothetical protein
MSRSLATKQVPQVSAGIKGGMVVAFYLLTFLTGGFFLVVGGKVGFAGDVTAALFYMAVTVLFHAFSKEA